MVILSNAKAHARKLLESLADGFAALGSAHGAPYGTVDRIGDEAHGAVAHADVYAAGVMATSRLTNFVGSTSRLFRHAGALGRDDRGGLVAVTVGHEFVRLLRVRFVVAGEERGVATINAAAEVGVERAVAGIALGLNRFGERRGITGAVDRKGERDHTVLTGEVRSTFIRGVTGWELYTEERAAVFHDVVGSPPELCNAQ